MLERAIALAKAGDKDGARTLLRQIVAEDSTSGTALDWIENRLRGKVEKTVTAIHGEELRIEFVT